VGGTTVRFCERSRVEFRIHQAWTTALASRSRSTAIDASRQRAMLGIRYSRCFFQSSLDYLN